MTFGQVIDVYLHELGINQSELARRMGSSRRTVNGLIKDKTRSPRLDTAVSVAAALGVPLQEMVDRMREDA